MREKHIDNKTDNKRIRFYRYFRAVFPVLSAAFILTGCTDSFSAEEKSHTENSEESGETEAEGTETEEIKSESDSVLSEKETEDCLRNDTAKPEAGAESEIREADWSEYFNGLNGAAVLYDSSADRCTVYNSELASTRRSPCSTFKIISSLVGLENGIITPEDSVRTWSGEAFWNEDWNRDIDFREAFRTSCVWYYREVADDIGKDLMQRELDKLHYGNCDISDWEGRLNTNNNNRALTGFWIESSLTISPREQVEVMERIFGEDSDYSEETQSELKRVMLVSDRIETEFPVYGKTGMGKAEGVVVDAWFTGFAAREEGNLYFCVYLGRTDGMDVSSLAAKETAIRLVADYGERPPI